jgi:hypothetical protein
MFTFRSNVDSNPWPYLARNGFSCKIYPEIKEAKMGRGLGPIQLKIIAVLAKYPLDSRRIVCRVYGVQRGFETPAQIESARQAMVALEKRKMIKRHSEKISWEGSPFWELSKSVVAPSQKRVKKRHLFPVP